VAGCEERVEVDGGRSTRRILGNRRAFCWRAEWHGHLARGRAPRHMGKPQPSPKASSFAKATEDRTAGRSPMPLAPPSIGRCVRRGAAARSISIKHSAFDPRKQHGVAAGLAAEHSGGGFASNPDVPASRLAPRIVYSLHVRFRVECANIGSDRSCLRRFSGGRCSVTAKGCAALTAQRPPPLFAALSRCETSGLGPATGAARSAGHTSRQSGFRGCFGGGLAANKRDFSPGHGVQS
jgi:hypothetical protein